jgi:heparosan-N-sulfate-glucuronate 5-epimerase
MPARDYPPLPTKPYDASGVYLWFDRYQYGHEYRFDGGGIPLMRSPQIGPQWVYNPVFITQHGLHAWSLWAKYRDRRGLGIARRVGRWLLRAQSPDGQWRYPFAFPLDGMDARLPVGWASAMEQGQAASLLTRLWRLHHGRRWLVAARRAMRPLTVSVRDGGLTADFNGLPYYEEYPTRPPSYTLNGFMFTLIGIYDLADTGRSRRAVRLWRDGLRTLKVALPFYDEGPKISAYHVAHLTQPPHPVHASNWYHRVHVIQLYALASITRSRYLWRWHDRWAAVKLPPKPE